MGSRCNRYSTKRCIIAHLVVKAEKMEDMYIFIGKVNFKKH